MTHPEVTLWANFKSPTGQGYTQDGKASRPLVHPVQPRSPGEPERGWLQAVPVRGALAGLAGRPRGSVTRRVSRR